MLHYEQVSEKKRAKENNDNNSKREVESDSRGLSNNHVFNEFVAN